MNNLHPGANLHLLASRSYANKWCLYVHLPRFDLNFDTRTSVFRVCSNSQPLCLSVLGDNNPKLPRDVCGGDFFGSDTNRAEQPQKVARA